MDVSELTTPESTAVARLTVELSSLVDRLQTDLEQRGRIAPETVAQVHELRERAETLFSD